MAAAVEAARAGVRVTVLDEGRRPGGQIYRQLHEGFSVTDPRALGSDQARGRTLLAEFAAASARVDYWPEALVWGLDDRDLAFRRGEGSYAVRYRKLIVAVGAYDRPVPFPGWTLPGVFTAGGAQGLVKTQRVLPGERILLVGTGPLQLALANQIVDAGGRVEAIAEAGRIESWLGLARGAWGEWGLLADAWRYWRGIRRAGIPLWRSHVVVEARGDGQVEEAVVAEADAEWRPRSGTERALPVDTVCVGYGFVPSVELTRLARCEHRYEPRRGGWVPARTPDLETSVPGLYAVGDCAGVAGGAVAIEEGRVAGLAAARSLGHLSPSDAERRMAPCRRRLARLHGLHRVLDEISVPRPGLYELARADTVLCRCEEITLGTITRAVADGAIDVNEVKRVTRAGMGHCQGRMCGPALQEIVARQRGRPPDAVGFLSPRPPVRPVSLGALAGHTELE
jgi:thioredoxin reductase/bacterioferritin-associated ferredoxin